MGRLRKHEREQAAYFHFGINKKTLEVERATETRSGELVLWRGSEVLRQSAGRRGASCTQCLCFPTHCSITTASCAS